MIFFAALKANELGKSVGEPIQNFGQNVFSTLPILPIWKGGKWVGVGSAFNVAKDIPSSYISNLDRKQLESLDKDNDDKIPESISSEHASTILAEDNVTADSIKAAVEKLWVKQEDIQSTLKNSSSLDNAYNVLNTFQDQTTKTKAIKAYGEASWKWDNWYKEQTKKRVNNLTSSIDDWSSQEEITTFSTSLNTNENNKKILKEYFEQYDSYTIDIWNNRTLKIEKTTTGSTDTYTVRVTP